MAADPRNAVIFIQKGEVNTLAQAVQQYRGPQALQLHLQMSQRVPLEGKELQVGGTTCGLGAS